MNKIYRNPFRGFLILPVIPSLISLFCLILLDSKVVSAEENKRTRIVIENNQPYARHNDIIQIRRKELGAIPAGFLPCVLKEKKYLVTQLVSDKPSRVWKYLLIQVNLAPNAKDTLTINWVSKRKAPQFEKIANVFFSYRSTTNVPNKNILFLQRKRGFVQNISAPVFQMEGPGIENDKIAFRAFFDQRNSKDVYGKIVPYPVLEKVGVGAGWHTLQPWGMDIFKTGTTLGAGGLAVLDRDSVYRLGDADNSTYQAKYTGPLQASFELTFKNWDTGSGKSDGTELVSISKGDFFYKDEIFVPLKSQQQLISGIANFRNDSLHYRKHNSRFSSVSVYGPQAENTGTYLGVAVMFPSDAFEDTKTDTSLNGILSHTTYLKYKKGLPDSHCVYFFACWEKTDARFSTKQGFDDYLQETADRLSNPVIVKVLKEK